MWQDYLRVRLRPKYSDRELARIYATPHNHTQWSDHLLRVQTTIATARWFTDVNSIADLSCGDATIAQELGADKTYLGDYAKGYEFTGPIDKTIKEIPDVDLFICSETLEHLDNPDAVLHSIRKKAKYLVLSTPLGETGTGNPEHYWGWDDNGIREMLDDTGFEPVVYQELNFYEPQYIYNYQIWGCR